MVWDPRRIAQRSWPEVVAFYRDLEDRNPDFQPLREVAEQLSARPYVASIGAATSGTALLVTPAALALFPGAAAAHEAVRLDVDMGGCVRLVPPSGEAYRGKVGKPSVVEGPVMPCLEHTLRQAGWIPRC